MYICIYIHTYIHTYIHAYIHTYIHTYLHSYTIRRVYTHELCCEATPVRPLPLLAIFYPPLK